MYLDQFFSFMSGSTFITVYVISCFTFLGKAKRCVPTRPRCPWKTVKLSARTRPSKTRQREKGESHINRILCHIIVSLSSFLT